MKRFHQVQFYMLQVMILCAFLACSSGQSSDKNDGTISNDGSLQLNIQWKDAQRHSVLSKPSDVDCNAINVAKVAAVVKSNSGSEVARGGPWDCSLGTGTIEKISPGIDYIVEVRGLDSNGRVIYYGRQQNVDVHKDKVTPVDMTLETVVPTPAVSMVKDIYTGAGGSFPHGLEIFRDLLFFVARQPDTGFELYTSDGTDAGTQLIKDIHHSEDTTPGTEAIPEPSEMTECNGVLYFVADDGSSGKTLWQTDGTRDNTNMIAGFGTTGITDPSHLIALDGQLFFSAEHGASGRELWQSDGTAAGTQLVHEINAGVESSNPHELMVMRGWLYFVADDGRHGYEIWRTNGTTTEMVQDIDAAAVPGTAGNTKDSFPTDLTAVNNRLFCRAVDASHGEEIWMITADDTFARADLVMDLNAYNDRSSRPRFLAEIDDTYLAFSAEQIVDGETETEYGTELWLYDVISGSDPFRVTDINLGSGRSCPGNFTTVGDKIYFTATNARDEEHLWSLTLGSTAAPECLTAAMVDPAPRHLTVLEGLLYFTAFEDRYGRELWYTDGTNTTRVSDLCPDACSSMPSDFRVLGDQLFFSAYDPDNGKELYRLDLEYVVEP